MQGTGQHVVLLTSPLVEAWLLLGNGGGGYGRSTDILPVVPCPPLQASQPPRFRGRGGGKNVPYVDYAHVIHLAARGRGENLSYRSGGPLLQSSLWSIHFLTPRLWLVHNQLGFFLYDITCLYRVPYLPGSIEYWILKPELLYRGNEAAGLLSCCSCSASFSVLLLSSEMKIYLSALLLHSRLDGYIRKKPNDTSSLSITIIFTF